MTWGTKHSNQRLLCSLRRHLWMGGSGKDLLQCTWKLKWNLKHGEFWGIKDRKGAGGSGSPITPSLAPIRHPPPLLFSSTLNLGLSWERWRLCAHVGNQKEPWHLLFLTSPAIILPVLSTFTCREERCSPSRGSTSAPRTDAKRSMPLLILSLHPSSVDSLQGHIIIWKDVWDVNQYHAGHL